MSHSYRILVVEDEVESIKLLCHILTKAGYEVITAKDGEEAILKSGEEGPDLIVMDVGMPVLDGIEACRYFKTKFSSPYLPVIFLTGRDDSSSIQKGLDMGCDDYIVKPFKWDILKRSIHNLLKIRSLSAQQDADPEAKQEITELRLELADSAAERENWLLSRQLFARILDNEPDNKRARAGVARIDRIFSDGKAKDGIGY